ncbi:MAG: hypothetical protein ABIY70_25565 [Capsulimonas sp.]|uniref:hypothetical protein n=1 Tax=Capsulimonas sp. TaxID=2494211 RepID=UPI003263A26C
MKITYFNKSTNKYVPYTDPIEADLSKAKKVIHSLSGDGSFLGVELINDIVLQFYYEEGTFWTELLDVKNRERDGCTITSPMADIALEAAYRREDIKSAMNKAGYSWLIWEHSKIDDSD